VSLLRERGTLTAGDGLLLRACCEIEERRQKAQAAVDDEGLVISATVLDRNGAPVTKTISTCSVRRNGSRAMHKESMYLHILCDLGTGGLNSIETECLSRNPGAVRKVAAHDAA
jgi:hypothetical protein